VAVPLYKMLLAYDGTEYRGWQIQPADETIQGHVERALSTLAKMPVPVVASGRTDAGVHARAQVAHFELARPIPRDGLRSGMNAILPRDIRVREVEEAPEGFHARYSARSKTYAYRLDRSKIALPFRSRFVSHYPHPLSRTALDEAAALFEGTHDFAGFRASSCAARTTTRQVFSSRFTFEEDANELVYEVTATGFLHHMIRNMVGTLLEVGRGKRPVISIRAILSSGDRTQAGPTAEAKGLHLLRVDYP